MHKKTVVTLDSEDWGNLRFRTQFICDRIPKDSANNVLLDGRLGLFSRIDMYWVNVSLNRLDLQSVAIDPNLRDCSDFAVNASWCEINPAQFARLADMVKKWFKAQPEYTQQRANVMALQTFFAQFGGYDNFISKGEQVRAEFRARAIALIRQNMGIIADYKAGKAKRDKLDEIFKTFCYTTHATYCGLDHIIWLYDTFVVKGANNAKN